MKRYENSLFYYCEKHPDTLPRFKTPTARCRLCDQKVGDGTSAINIVVDTGRATGQCQPVIDRAVKSNAERQFYPPSPGAALPSSPRQQKTKPTTAGPTTTTKAKLVEAQYSVECKQPTEPAQTLPEQLPVMTQQTKQTNNNIPHSGSLLRTSFESDTPKTHELDSMDSSSSSPIPVRLSALIAAASPPSLSSLSSLASSSEDDDDDDGESKVALPVQAESEMAAAKDLLRRVEMIDCCLKGQELGGNDSLTDRRTGLKYDLEKERDVLINENEDLRQDRNKLQKQFDALLEENEKLRREKTSLQHENNEIEEKVSSLIETNKDLREKHAVLQKEHADLKELFDSTSDSRKQELSTLKDSHHQLKLDHQILLDKAKKQEEQIRVLQQEKQSLLSVAAAATRNHLQVTLKLEPIHHENDQKQEQVENFDSLQGQVAIAIPEKGDVCTESDHVQNDVEHHSKGEYSHQNDEVGDSDSTIKKNEERKALSEDAYKVLLEQLNEQSMKLQQHLVEKRRSLEERRRQREHLESNATATTTTTKGDDAGPFSSVSTDTTRQDGGTRRTNGQRAV